jgi:HEAT repeat protein
VRKATAIGTILAITVFGLTVLGQAQSRKASVSGLVYDLKHPDADRRVEAAKALGNAKAHEAVPALVEAAGDPDADVRAAVLDALDQIRDPRALPAYVKLSADERADTRQKSLDAMVHLYVLDETGFIAGTKKVLSFFNPFDSNYNDLVVEPYIKVSNSAIEAAAARLDDPEEKVRKAAIMSLGIFRAQAAMPRMKEVLPQEPSGNNRIEYFRSFYKIGSQEACSELVPHINDPDKPVHDEAIEVSGLLRCRDAVPALMDIYESGIKERRTVLKVIPASSDEDLQRRCLVALSMIADPRAKKLFLPALNHTNGDFRIAAAEGLARLADPDTLPAIEKAYTAASKDRHFQLALIFAFYRLGQKNRLTDLVRELDSTRYDQQAYGYLLELPPAQLPDLYPALRASKGGTRVKLLEILGLRGDAATLKEVQQYTHDSNADTAAAALNAVRRIQARIGA